MAPGPVPQFPSPEGPDQTGGFRPDQTGGFHPEQTGGFHTESLDRAALRRPPGAPSPQSTIYRARRAGTLGVLAVVAAVAELLLVRVLLTGEFARTVVPGAVLGGIFAMTGIPLVAMGLYGLITGAPATGPTPERAWLRTPLAYLPIGLTLLIAAGLAAA
jgi:hypothetical protein